MNPINRLTIEQVRAFFEQEGYILLSKNYENSCNKLTYLCPKGHRGLMSWTTFKGGHRCFTCSYEIRKSKNKKDLGEIKQYIEQQGYQCLTQLYVNNRQKLDLICPKGHEWHPTWNSFNTGRRCAVCAGKAKRSLIEICRYIEQEGYKLLSKMYVNTHAKIILQCCDGHKYTTRWNDFLTGYRCRICKYKKDSDNKTYSFAYIKQQIESDAEKYILLSKKYIGCNSKLSFECPKGHRYQTSWNIWQVGARCPKCTHRQSRPEQVLGEILKEIFPSEQIDPQSNLGVLGRQRADYAILILNMAFEYDGEQHFRPIRFNGISEKTAEELFRQCQRLDRQKERLCKQNNICLIRIQYNEPLTVMYVKEKIRRLNPQINIGE